MDNPQKAYITKSVLRVERGLSMNAYRAVGALKTGKFSWQKFSIELAANDEAHATEQVYSNLGSRHKLKRQEIRIDEITLLDKDNITNLAVQYIVGGEQ